MLDTQNGECGRLTLAARVARLLPKPYHANTMQRLIGNPSSMLWLLCVCKLKSPTRTWASSGEDKG